MLRVVSTAAFALVLLVGWPVAAELLWPPKAFKCLFPGGVSADDKGKGLSPETTGPMAFTLASIDTKTKTAQLIGNIGANKVRVIPGDGGLHFLNLTGSGNLVVTTVFASTDAEGKFHAVHSRHVSIDGPIVSQYYGSCEGLW